MDNHNDNAVNDDRNDHDDDDNDNDAAAVARRIERRCKLKFILDRWDDFPLRQRNRIDELVDHCYDEIQEDIHDMIRDQGDNNDDYHYNGLNSDHDTLDEVELAIRSFPDVLDGYNIQLLLFLHGDDGYYYNIKAASFAYIFIRLAMEFNTFPDHERGGLLNDVNNYGINALQSLSLNIMSDNLEENEKDQLDNILLTELVRLKQMGLIMREDIQEFDLVTMLCGGNHFSTMRFRFLVEWNPNILLHTSEEFGRLPLHSIFHRGSGTLETFRTVFEYGMMYFPNHQGINILFRKNIIGETSFQIACSRYGPEQIMHIVEEALSCYTSSSPTTTTTTTTTATFNDTDALLTAVIDDTVHIDGVYFFLRRQPDILITKLLLTAPLADEEDDSRSSSSKEDILAKGASETKNCNRYTMDDSDDAVITPLRKRKRKPDDND